VRPSRCVPSGLGREIPPAASRYGIFATEAADAMMPCESRPCIGLAPGANGSPLRRPSGVCPVFLPYTTFEVIVSTDWVWIAFRYVGYFLSLFMNIDTTVAAS